MPQPPPGYKTTAECWQQYPKLKFPDSVVRGKAQKRARDACVAASMRGEADPKLIKGPAILDNAKALWGSKGPKYKIRPKDTAGNTAKVIGRIATLGISSLKSGGDTLRTIAVGWRPPTGPGTSRFREAETKGTILGGMDALIAAGVQPWPQLAGRIEKLPQMRLRGFDNVDLPLLGIVRDGARALGEKPPKTLTAAAEFIRQRVKKSDLAAAAWHARAIRIAVTGKNAQAKASAASSAAAIGMGATAKGLYAAAGATAPTLLGPIIFGVAGGIVDMTGTIIGIAGGTTALQKARTDNFVKESAGSFQQELQLRNIRVENRYLEDQLNKSSLDVTRWLPEAQLEGDQMKKIALGGVIGLTAAGVFLLASRARRH